MLLIIIILCVIVAISCAINDQKDIVRNSSNEALTYRKTNAVLERRIVDGFMKEGKTLDEAYHAGQAEICKRGFSPCIPKSKYGTVGFTKDLMVFDTDESSYVGDIEEYDSEIVRERRKQFRREKIAFDDELLYADFPTNNYECQKELEGLILRRHAIPKGDLFTMPGIGVLEVVDYDYSKMKYGIGYYIAKETETGETRRVSMSDKRIRIIK